MIPRVEMYLDGDYYILPDVRQNPPVKVIHGSKDEATKPSPSKCTFVLNDPVGDYDPDNAMGQWFGDLKENTRVRATVPLTEPVDFTQSIADGPGSDADQIPGEFWDSEVRFHVQLPTNDVTGGIAGTVLQLRWVDADNYVWVQVVWHTSDSVQIGVIERVAGVNRRLLADTRVYPDGTLAADNAFSIAVLLEGSVVRAKAWADGDPEPLNWQVECGRVAAQSGAIFLASTLDGSNTNTMPWVMEYENVQIGIPVFYGEIAEFKPAMADESHAAPTMEIVASGIRRRVMQGTDPLKSAMFRAWGSTSRWIREGSALSAAAVGDFNTLTCLDADAADVAIGNQFSLINDRNQYKEDQIFTVTAKSSAFGFTNIDFTPDAIDPIVVGDSLNSWRIATQSDLPIAYWPCEDERGSVSIASGLLGGNPLEIRGETPEFANFDSFPGGSSPILKLNDAELYGVVPNYDNTNQAFTFHFLTHFPDVDEAATGQAIAQFYCSGNAEVWAIQYATGGGDGDLVISAFDTETSTQLFSTPYDHGLRGRPVMVAITLAQTGPSTVTYTMTTVAFTPTGGFRVWGPSSATATGVTTLGKLTAFQINPGNGYVDVGIGHIGVIPSALAYTTFIDIPKGYQGENLPQRFSRLSYEEHEPVTFRQGLQRKTSPIVGAQQRDTLLNNWQSNVDVDMGLFFEPKGAYTFEYRSRATLYNQDYILDLDYKGGAVRVPLIPTRDDQGSRNDVTVKRQGGSSARFTKETGPKSVAEIGRYTEAPTLNASNDRQLPSLASWRVHLGTVVGERYPTITLQSVDEDVLPLAQMLSVGVGDRIRISNLVDRRRYEPIDQLVPGYTLTLHQYVPTLVMNCVPASPYNIVILDDGELARLDSDTSELQQDIDANDTTFVVTTIKYSWTTTPAHFPFDILVGGERMTVTSITGTGFTVQDFFVTRAVNGVSRGWPSGTKVSLANPVYLA